MNKTAFILRLSSLILLLAISAPAEDYVLPEPIPVWVEETVRSREVQATGYSVEQLSIVRLPGGGLQCRATLQITDGTNTYRRMLTATHEQLIAAIGETNLTALIRSMGQTVGVVLSKEGNGL